MPNRRSMKKYNQKKMDHRLEEMRERLETQEAMVKMMSDQLAGQQEILRLYYQEYQELKKRQERQHLMSYIRMRDAMLKDVEVFKQKNETMTMGYSLLHMYINELTELLDDHGVEVIERCPEDVFEPEIEKPIDRVFVHNENLHNHLYKVFNCGYRWNGIMLKKIDVSVCIYR